MKLTTRIKQSGMSARFIAKESGVNYDHLRRILKGKLELRPKTLRKLTIFAEKYIK